MKLKNIKKQSKYVTIMVLLFSFLPFISYAEIPNQINYQGKLKDSGGNSITAPTTIQFSLYSHITNGSSSDTPSSSGPLLWTETYDGSGSCSQITPDSDGIFAQHLGSCVPFPSYLDFTDKYYLGVKIGTDAEATPRVPFATNPYAFTSKAVHAENEDVNIDTETSGNIVLNSVGNIQLQANDATSALIVDQQGIGNLFELQNNGTTSFIVDGNGRVGIGGILNPGKLLEVSGTAGYLNASDMGMTDADFASKGYVDEQLMWEIVNGGERIQPKNHSVRQIYVEEDSNSYTQFMVRNNNDTGNGAGAIIELKGSGADYTNNMYIGKYGAGFWIPELQNQGAVLTDRNLVIGTASAAQEIHFVTGNSYSDLRPVVVADNEGFRYTSDLSATFVDRTLVDKEYVDSAITGGQPTFQDVVDRSIAVDGYAHADLGAGEIEDDGGILAVKAHVGKDFDYGVDSFLTFSLNGGMGDAGHAYIYDDRSAGSRRGLEYAADYSADYTNRTLVDKEYVDNAILTGADTLYLADGTLAADRTVTGNNHSLSMTDLSSLYQEVSSGGDTSYIEVGSDELLFGTTVAAGSGSAFGTQGDNAYMQVDNGAGSLSSIVFRTTDMTVADQINLKGLVYADDYSANYTNRSLVDKEYVDTQVTNGVTASNGLNKVGPDIKLGGSLSQYTVVDKNDNGVLFTGLGTFGVRYGTGTTYPHLDIGFHSFELGYHTASDDVSFGVSMGGKMTMTDTRHLTGIEYAADYSANYTNRSLVDKEYVDNAILSGTNNIYNSDGTLTGNRTVSLNGNDLLFSGSGNIGIGVSNPVNKLQINGNVRSTRFVGSNGTQGSPIFRFDSDADTGMFRGGVNQLAFTTGGNERVRIDDNGRVGIGTASPDRMLQINGNAHINRALQVDDSAMIYTDHTYNDNTFGELYWNLLQTQKTDDPNDAEFATITSGTGWKQVTPITRWKIGNEKENGQHYGYVGYFPLDGWNSSFRINTSGKDDTNLSLGAMSKDVINITASDLFVGIGTDTPTAQLHTTEGVRFSHFGAGTMQTDANGNVSVSSDERLKNIQGDFDRGLEDLLQLRPIEYKWKDSTGYDTENSYYGFSAQNVQMSIPEAVGEDNRGFLTLADRPILATVVNAIKEQQQQIDALGGHAVDSAQTIKTKLVDDVRNVLEEVVFTAEVEFEKTTTFFADAIFTDKVTFMDRVTFADKDMAGTAIIGKGDDEIKVKFDKDFVFTPFVTATVNNAFILYKVTDVTESSFKIKIQDKATKDIQFTWQAITVGDTDNEIIDDEGDAASESSDIVVSDDASDENVDDTVNDENAGVQDDNVEDSSTQNNQEDDADTVMDNVQNNTQDE